MGHQIISVNADLDESIQQKLVQQYAGKGQPISLHHVLNC